MNKPKYTPLGTRILIKEQPPETKTQGGIIIPDTVKVPRYIGEIIAKGHLSTYPIEVGNKVMYPQDSGTEVMIDNEKYILMFEESIEAVL